MSLILQCSGMLGYGMGGGRLTPSKIVSGLVTVTLATSV